MQGIVGLALLVLAHLTLTTTPSEWYCYYLHFTVQDTQASRDVPKFTHSWYVALNLGVSRTQVPNHCVTPWNTVVKQINKQTLEVA